MDSLRYLLDTNVLSTLIRDPRGRIAETITRRGPETICTSIIVAAELRFGARKRGSPNLTARVDDLLAAIAVLPLESGSDQTYATIRLDLERRGTPIGPNDLLIAAQALSRNLILVTANISEFQRVPGLDVEDWAQS